MEVRVLIVSLACLSCLVPPALGKEMVVKAAAIGAAKGAVLGGIKGAVIGAKLGLAAKGAVALVAKKALLGVLLKAVALKAIVKKKALIKGALALKGLGAVLAAKKMMSSLGDRAQSDDQTTTSRSPLLDILSGTAGVVQSTFRLTNAAAQTSRGVYRAVSSVPRLLVPNFTK